MTRGVEEISAEEYRALTAKASKLGKYNSRRVTVDGITFDSQAEADRWWDLCHLERAGVIRDLEVHPRIPLSVGGVQIGHYVGDFRYVDVESGRTVIEDVKSPITKTPIYEWKKRHVRAQYGIEITEVAA